MANRRFLKTNPDYSGISADVTHDSVVWVMGVDTARSVAVLHQNYGEDDKAHEDERELLAAVRVIDPTAEEREEDERS